MRDEFLFDVFVSHAPADRDWVEERLIPELLEAGLTVCTEDRSFDPGVPVLENAENAVAESRRVVLVITPAWMEGHWSRFASLLAQHEDPTGESQRTIPLLLRAVALPRRLAILSQVDLTSRKGLDAGISKLVDALHGRRRLAPPPSWLSGSDARRRSSLLDRVHEAWISGVLERSLHGQALIELGLRKEPRQVEHPWEMILEIRERESCPLPAGARIAEVFEETGRSLLILGEPGAGKTTMLLDLAKDLLLRARDDEEQPVPVVFHLSTWSESRPPLCDWLIEELASKYQVSPRIGERFVEEEQLVLLLDGLDEVEAEHRAACIDAVHRFLADHEVPLAACCRTEEYRALGSRLHLQAAVALEPLSPGQLASYLDRAGPEMSGLREVLASDRDLREMAQSPLMLSIMTLAYRGKPVEELGGKGGESRHHLFETYVGRMLERRARTSRHPPAQIRSALEWLAARMVKSHQTILLMEDMRPSWLGAWLPLYAWIVGLVEVGLFTAPVAATLFAELRSFDLQRVEKWSGPLLILALGLGLAIALSRTRIRPAAVLHWSLKRAGFSALVFGLFVIIMTPVIVMTDLGFSAQSLIASSVGAVVGLAAGWWSGRFLTRRFGLERGGARGAWLGVLSGLGGGLLIGALRQHQLTEILWLTEIIALKMMLPLSVLGGFRQADLVTRTAVNLGIRKSLRNALFAGAVGGLVCLVAFDLELVPRTSRLVFQPSPLSLFLTWVGALGAALWFGGFACLKHYCLRLVLAGQGKLPWRCGRLLQDAEDCVLLQRVGGGYVFVHRLLMEHLAGQESGTPPLSTPDEKGSSPNRSGIAWMKLWLEAPGGRIFPVPGWGLTANALLYAVLVGGLVGLLERVFPVYETILGSPVAWSLGGVLALCAWLLGRDWRFIGVGLICGIHLGGCASASELAVTFWGKIGVALLTTPIVICLAGAIFGSLGTLLEDR